MLGAYQASTEHTSGEANLVANVTVGAAKSSISSKVAAMMILVLQVY